MSPKASFSGVIFVLSVASSAIAEPPAPAAHWAPVPKPSDAQVDSSVARPFGPGQVVEVQCSESYGVLYVARGAVEPGVVFPDPFVKVGPVPVDLELPPGVFTVLVEGDRFPSASTVFEVGAKPVQVRVDAGSQGLRDLGTLISAVGVAAVLAGAAIELSGSTNEESSKKRKLTIPLFIGGGVALVGGVTMYAVSGSSIEHNGYVTQVGMGPRSSRWQGLQVAGIF